MPVSNPGRAAGFIETRLDSRFYPMAVLPTKGWRLETPYPQWNIGGGAYTMRRIGRDDHKLTWPDCKRVLTKPHQSCPFQHQNALCVGFMDVQRHLLAHTDGIDALIFIAVYRQDPNIVDAIGHRPIRSPMLPNRFAGVWGRQRIESLRPQTKGRTHENDPSKKTARRPNWSALTNGFGKQSARQIAINYSVRWYLPGHLL